MTRKAEYRALNNTRRSCPSPSNTGRLEVFEPHNLNAEVIAVTFLPDGRVVRPDGVALIGHDAILAEQNESFARFRATHMLTDHVITQSGNTAQVRANMQAMHLWNDAGNTAELQTHFVAGGVLRASADLTSDGWRLIELTMRPTWRTGATTRMFLSDHR